jgi:hypothetical protein
LNEDPEPDFILTYAKTCHAISSYDPGKDFQVLEVPKNSKEDIELLNT